MHTAQSMRFRCTVLGGWRAVLAWRGWRVSRRDRAFCGRRVAAPAVGGRHLPVFDETRITYALRSPVAPKTALSPPREWERSSRYLEGGISTLHSQQCVAKCQQGTQHVVRGIHNHASPCALRTPHQPAAARAAATAPPKPAGRSRRGPVSRSRRARQLSIAREHQRQRR